MAFTLISEPAIELSILPLVAIGPDGDKKEIKLLFRNRQYKLCVVDIGPHVVPPYSFGRSMSTGLMFPP
ncbi:hypothetical protein E2977_14655 [Paracoccus yeei]